MLILSLEGCQFQGAQAEFTFNFPPYLSQTSAHFLYHPQPLWWPQSDRTLCKVQDWQQSIPIPKQDNCELKKVPSNCTNWGLVWGGNSVSNTGNYSQSSREASSLPITDMQCISMEGSIPSRTFLRRKTLTGKSRWASEPVAVAASFSGLVILFLWLTPRDGTKTRVHHFKQDWQ